MRAEPDLEDYLRTARAVHVAPLGGGGGHAHKQLVVLEGGLGAVAKLISTPDPAGQDQAARQVPREVAAWRLARALGWYDLVPVTTLGVVRSLFNDQFVAASLQVAWPLFQVAAELQKSVGDCEHDDVWRVAIFDALAGNTDRNPTNWGFVKDV